jgi:hypothetical protein
MPLKAIEDSITRFRAAIADLDRGLGAIEDCVLVKNSEREIIQCSRRALALMPEAIRELAVAAYNSGMLDAVQRDGAPAVPGAKIIQFDDHRAAQQAAASDKITMAQALAGDCLPREIRGWYEDSAEAVTTTWGVVVTAMKHASLPAKSAIDIYRAADGEIVNVQAVMNGKIIGDFPSFADAADAMERARPGRSA